MAEGGEGEGEVGGSRWVIRALHALWVRPQSSVRRSSVYVTNMGVWGRGGGRRGRRGGRKVLMGEMRRACTVG